MWVANWAVGYVAHSEAFDDEQAAETFLDAELRRTGSKHGVVYQVDWEMA